MSQITFERWHESVEKTKRAQGKTDLVVFHPSGTSAKTIFCNSGFEAVEAAVKTSRLATGQPGIIAFEGAYHGLGYGALNATHREHFRGLFRKQLGEFGHFVPLSGFRKGRRKESSSASMGRKSDFSHVGSEVDELALLARRIRQLFRQHSIGAILVEPMQARGGIRIPPPEFLPTLRGLCDEHGALLILDEIYTGFGRTGAWFACEHSGVVPDVICLGKALTGGFPLSACVGRADVMDFAWPESGGEAIHTSTFLGHPVGCAMALAQMGEIRRLKLPQRSRRLGDELLGELKALHAPNLKLSARGAGLMVGLELQRPDGKPATAEALDIIKRMLHRGFILLPEGEHSNVIAFTPPLTITAAQLRQAVRALNEELGRRA